MNSIKEERVNGNLKHTKTAFYSTIDIELSFRSNDFCHYSNKNEYVYNVL